jgi:hypothetical protein
MIAENFPDVGKGKDIQLLEAFRTPNIYDQKRNFPLHIIVKIPSVPNKEKIPKATKEKYQVIYKAKPIRKQQTSQQKP